MAFNDRGEIIRNSGEPGRRNSSDQHNRNGNTNNFYWIRGLIYIVGAILFTALFIQITRSDKYESLNEENNLSEQNATYHDTTILAPPIMSEQDALLDTSDKDAQNSTQVKTNTKYGLGKGKITIYKTSKEASNVKIIIDGRMIGTLSKTYSYKKEICKDSSTISAVLPVGKHTLSARCSLYNWRYEVSILEGECTQQELYLDELDIDLFKSKFAGMLTGKWYGKIYEKEIDKWQSVFLSCNLSKRDFRINYPSSGSMGTWEFDEVNKRGLDFEENILFELCRFHYGRRIHVKIIDGEKIMITYYLDNIVTATGTLVKLQN